MVHHNKPTTRRRPAKRRAGRPTSQILSHERIIQSAFAIASKRDTEFTLSAIAHDLEVVPQALHHYFSNREQLITTLRGELTRQVDSTIFNDRPWWEAAIEWAENYRRTLVNYPGLIVPLATAPVAGEPESMEDYERIVGAFQREGFPEHLILPSLISIESFIIGSALDSLAPFDNLRPTAEVEASTEKLSAAEKAASKAAQERGSNVTGETFRVGLAALIHGLRAVGEGTLEV